MPPGLMASSRMPVQVRQQPSTNTPTNSSRSSSSSTHSRRTRDRRRRQRHSSGSAGSATTSNPYVIEDVLCRYCGQFHEKNGPHLYDYPEEVDDDFNCHICLQPLVNPVDTVCHHTFCYPCLKNHLRFQKSCPIDRNSLTSKDIRPTSILLNKLLDKLVVICPNTEYCQITLPRCELEAHLANRCQGAPSICARANLGCLFTGPRALLQNHIGECPFYQNLSSKELSSRVEEGVVSVIELNTEGGIYDLGMTIIGGVDTPLIYVMIQEIFPTGAVAKDGRLRVNDQILDVNGADLTVMTHKECVDLIMRASGSQTKSRIAIYREVAEESGKSALGEEVIKVSLDKTIQQFLGLKLTTKKFHGIAGLYVDELVADGVAFSDGRLRPEDRILEINGENVRDAPQEKAVQLIQSCDCVEFVVSRFPRSSPQPEAVPTSCLPSTSSSSPGATGSPVSGAFSSLSAPPNSSSSTSSSTVVAEHVALSFGRSVSYPCAQFETFNQGGNGVSSFLKSTPTPSSASSSTASPATTTTSSSTTPPTAPAESDISDDLPMRHTVETVVHIAKQAGESLGISVAGGKSTNHAVVTAPSSAAGAVEGGSCVRSHDIPIYVTKISSGGCMEKHGGVGKGDIITIVNGVSLFGLTHSEAVKVLKSVVASTSVSLHVIDGGQSKSTSDANASFVPTWDYWLCLPPHVQPLKTITIRRSESGSLGFSIVGGVDSGCILSQAIFVKSILPGSPAYLDGRLRCGDVIVAVDDAHLSRVNHAHAVELLKKGKSSNVVLIVVSWPGSIL